MAYSKNYDRSLDAGSSGGEVNDLNPQRAYDVDIRRLDEDEREIAKAADTRNVGKQNRTLRTFRGSEPRQDRKKLRWLCVVNKIF